MAMKFPVHGYGDNMAADTEFFLPNGVKVNLFEEDPHFEEALEIATSKDFLHETNIMQEIGNFPPYHLMVYDNVLGLGTLIRGGGFAVGLRDYDEELLKQFVEMPLSLWLSPVRVVNKTTDPEETFRRIKPWMEKDWIEYDPDTQVLKEISGKTCPAQIYLQSMPPCKDLYTTCESFGTVYVSHKQIEDLTIGVIQKIGDKEVGEIRADLQAMALEDGPYEGSLESVEVKLREEHPEAIIIREPLSFCSQGSSSKPYSCIATMFERIYAKKKGYI